MKKEEPSLLRQLAGHRTDIKVEEEALQQRQRDLDAEQPRELIDIAGEVDIEQKEVEQDKEHPEGEDPVLFTFILLGDQEEFDEDGEANTRNEEHGTDNY